MAVRIKCPGLPASWINGWLAAVGATVLDSRLRLQWSDEAAPVAVLSAVGDDPISILKTAWPRERNLLDMPLAETWRQADRLKRKVNVKDFKARAQAARSDLHSWTLSSTMTDLCVDKNGEVAHAKFDPAGPGTIKWLHHRLRKVHKHARAPSVEDLLASFENKSARVRDNGLGFDLSRFGSLADESHPMVDPFVEVLAFYGLYFFPVRGLGRKDSNQAVQRGWLDEPAAAGRKSRQVFLWPAWQQRLDRDSIDALLDAWVRSYRSQTWKRHWELLGIHAAWRVVPYKGRGQGDRTRGFGSERL